MYVLKLWHSHGHDKPRLRETRQVPSHNAIMPTTIRLKRAKSCLLARWMARLPTNKGSRNPAVTKARVLSVPTTSNESLAMQAVCGQRAPSRRPHSSAFSLALYHEESAMKRPKERPFSKEYKERIIWVAKPTLSFDTLGVTPCPRSRDAT